MTPHLSRTKPYLAVHLREITAATPPTKHSDATVGTPHGKRARSISGDFDLLMTENPPSATDEASVEAQRTTADGTYLSGEVKQIFSLLLG